jgi:hypothetical protein
MKLLCALLTQLIGAYKLDWSYPQGYASQYEENNKGPEHQGILLINYQYHLGINYYRCLSHYLDIRPEIG